MVAVSTAEGPHVTPQAFADVAGDLWLVAPRRSLKVRAVRSRPEVGVLAGDTFVRGRGSVLGARQLAVVGPLASLAGPTYVARNAPLLAGIGLDALLRGMPPGSRSVIRVTTEDRVALGGDFDLEITIGPVASRRGPFDEAALGLLTDDGPAVVPARWDDEGGVATVRSTDLDAVGVRSGRVPACLTLSSSPGLRPSGFSGVLLRGHLDQARRRLTVSRRSWWDGYDTGSEPYR